MLYCRINISRWIDRVLYFSVDHIIEDYNSSMYEPSALKPIIYFKREEEEAQ